MSHHDHVVLNPQYLCIMCVLELINEFPIHRMCFNSFPLLQNNHYLVLWGPAGETRVLHIPGLIRLTYNYVAVRLHLKHSDLSAGIRHQERIPLKVKFDINWLVRSVLIFQINKEQKTVLL